ncbi:MAG: hypothetical protein WBQ69_06985 [Gallionella sp.]
MLSLLILWTTSAIIFALIGTPVLYACNLHTCLPRPEDRIFVAVWMGMIVLANLLLLVSIFAPITLYVAAIIVGILAIPYFFRHSGYAVKGLSIEPATAWLLIVVALLALVFTTLAQDTVEDTGLYHHQMINWLAEYGSVHGLALINNPFGYTDSWFALIAPLQTGWLKDHFITGMDGFIFCLMAMQAILLLGRIIGTRHTAGIDDWFFVVAFALFCRFSFSDLIHSPSPDTPVTLLVLVVAWLVVTIAVSGNAKTSDGEKSPRSGAVILAAGAVSIKLSALPLLAIAVIYFVFAGGFTWRKVLTSAAIVVPFAIIHMWVSTITSGCPLYPAPYLCTDFPWSVGSENAKYVSSSTYEFLKWVGPAPPDATSFNWLWHRPPNNNVFNDKPLMRLLLVVNMLCGAWLYSKRSIVCREALIFTPLLAISGIAFTIFILPHLRFGVGFFLIIPALACALLFTDSPLSKNKYSGYLNKLKIPMLLIAAYLTVMPMAIHSRIVQYGFASSDDVIKNIIDNAPMLAIWSAPPINPAAVDIVNGNDFQYFQPTLSKNPGHEPPLCWGTPLPCAQMKLANVWLRNENAGFKEGFVKAK